jgi:hypothetical protein
MRQDSTLPLSSRATMHACNLPEELIHVYEMRTNSHGHMETDGGADVAKSVCPFPFK